MTDLPTAIFLQLRHRFFDDAGGPIPFVVRDKLNTQDDPFDFGDLADLLKGEAILDRAVASLGK